MTPYGAVQQRVYNVSYTTPAKRGSKIGARAYCRNVISGRGLFRLVLNVSIGISEESICACVMCPNYF